MTLLKKQQIKQLHVIRFWVNFIYDISQFSITISQYSNQKYFNYKTTRYNVLLIFVLSSIIFHIASYIVCNYVAFCIQYNILIFADLFYFI